MKKIIFLLLVLLIVIVLAEPAMSLIGELMAESANEAIFTAIELPVR